MGFWDILRSLFSSDGKTADGSSYSRRRKGLLSGKIRQRNLDSLCSLLELTRDQLFAVPLQYRTVQIPKRSGGVRTLTIPCDELKAIQRRVLWRVLGRIASHPAAMGFEKETSIAHNATPHVGAKVVVKMDIRDFFPSTPPQRVEEMFLRVGWDADAARLLTTICTHDNGLPQGAPTSPRLSNLVNYILDVRLSALTQKFNTVYTRYADDMTFSFHLPPEASTKGKRRPRYPIAGLIRMVKHIAGEYGYTLHHEKKLRVARRHQRMQVIGLVVNDKLSVPRAIRRRLRAVAHHIETNRPASLTADQLKGWIAFMEMVEDQQRKITTR